MTSSIAPLTKLLFCSAAIATLMIGCGPNEGEEPASNGGENSQAENNHADDNHANHNHSDKNHGENNHSENHTENNHAENNHAENNHAENHMENNHSMDPTNNSSMDPANNSSVEPTNNNSMDPVNNNSMDPTNNDPMDPPEHEELVYSPSSVTGEIQRADDGTLMWLLKSEDGMTQLSVEMYEAFGALTEPGTIMIDADESSYATCGTCFVLQTGCMAHGDHYHCDRTYMPSPTGQVRFDAIGMNSGDSLTGEATGLIFEEVTIGQDYSTTRVANGHTLSLPSWSFDVVLEGSVEPPAPECGGHGHAHGSQCHCDAGYKIDPNDSLNCIPE